MSSVGERLRLLRETRNTTIEEMVTATGIGLSYLEALERDAIEELPGKAFGKLYIRAYAEVFTFDPQPFIDDYDREQRLVAGASTEPTSSAPAGSRPVAAAIAQWKAARAAADKPEPVIEEVDVVEDVEDVAAIEPEAEAPPEQPIVSPEVSAPPSVRAPAAKRRVAPFVLIGVIVIAVAIYFGMRGTGGDKSAGPITEAQPVVRPVLESRPSEPPPPGIAEPSKPPPAKPLVVRESPVGSLTVPEFGVGRRIVNSRLEGERSEFAAGEVACFQTRVVGGTRGETIRHVWIYDGRAQQAITLRLGGPDWRTHTNKTLYKTGPWTVEARDGNGRVLAWSSFTCVTGGR